MNRLRTGSLVILACCAALVMNGCVMFNSVGFSLLGDSKSTLTQRTVVPAEGRLTKKKVLMVDIAGVIDAQSGDGLLSGYEPSLVESVRSVIELAREDENIEAILLRIDSPGGGVTATDIVYNELMRYKEDEEVPIVAALMQMAASGGYYLACTSDRIVAHPTTLTGSISVISHHLNVEGLMGKVGVESEVIKTGDKKDMGSLFRSMTEEEKAIFQSLADDCQQRFIDVVDEGRPGLDREQVATLADGRIFSTPQAVEAGLVDEVGYLEDAFESAKELAGLDDASLVVYTRRGGDAYNIYSPTASTPRNLDLGMSAEARLLRYMRTLSRSGQPSLLWLWEPGLAGVLNN
ncbi:MAG: signal peptide peptidase SppA [bacterium]|nr:signal peptide peptidase SppA [bacterium]